MKVAAMLLGLLLLGAGSVYFIAYSPANNAPLSTLFSGDSAALAKQAQSFMEDLQYKDFKSAAEYSLPEQRESMDIPRLIERLFQVKPEFLDINNIQIAKTDLDSSGKRARVYINTEVKMLNTNKIKKPEVILYFKKGEDERWYMDLASSLK